MTGIRIVSVVLCQDHSRMWFAFYSAECCHLVGMVSLNLFVMKKTVKNTFSY